MQLWVVWGFFYLSFFSPLLVSLVWGLRKGEIAWKRLFWAQTYSFLLPLRISPTLQDCCPVHGNAVWDLILMQLLTLLWCQNLDFTPTPARTGEQSLVEMSNLRGNPPWLIPHFPFLPSFVQSFPRHKLWHSHCFWCHLHDSGSPTSLLVCAGYGVAPGDGCHAPSAVEQPCLHPHAHSSMDFPQCPGQLQEQCNC